MNNVDGTLLLLDAMRQAGFDQLVFSSSGAVYGNAESLPLHEDFCLRAHQSLWDLEMADRTDAGGLREPMGLDCSALRYFNAAGADAGGGIREVRDPRRT